MEIFYSCHIIVMCVLIHAGHIPILLELCHLHVCVADDNPVCIPKRKCQRTGMLGTSMSNNSKLKSLVSILSD